MAFNKSSAAAASTTVAVPGNWEKAQGFINIYLPRKDGSQMKLGALALRISKNEEKQVLDYLASSEENIQKLANRLVFEFRAVNENRSELDLA